MNETKCTQCGQELPHDPVQKIGVVKWIHPNSKDVAFDIEGELIRAFPVYCKNLGTLPLREGDRVELTVSIDKYGPKVIGVALPAQVLTAEPAEAAT